MKTIGLTGGIGSGKSTAANLFKEKGVPVFEADKVSKSILSNNTDVKREVQQLLGDEAYGDDRQPDRKFIANRVFNDDRLLDGLNKILHPRVHESFDRWKDTTNSDYVIYEAAIIFEHGTEGQFDATLLITADKENRIKRVMERDQVTRKQVENRMENQWEDAEKIDKATYVIENNALKKLALNIDQLHNELSE